MAYQQPPRDTMEAYMRIRDLRMIVLSSVVRRIIQYRINNPGQYPHPTCDSHYNINHDHAPTTPSPAWSSRRPTTVSEIDRPRTWMIHRDQLCNNNLIRTSGHNSAVVVNPLQTASPLNPHAPEFSSLNPYAPEIRSLSPHAPEISSLNPYAPEFILRPNTWRDEEIYEELKTRKTREEDEVEANVCVVCIDDLSEKENDEDDEEETIATLTCGHEYHVRCIKSWLRRKNVCPLCNAVALPRR